MKNTKTAKSAVLLGLLTLAFVAGCVVRPVEYREGYWDRDHARYWHNHSWVACGPDDWHCR